MTEYFVSSSEGSDSNNGISEQSPFQTWNKVIQEASSGDTVRFKRGDSFVGNLSQWNYPAVITLGAYGEGPLPIISKTGDSVGGWLMLRSGGGTVDIRVEDLRFESMYGGVIRLGSSTVTQGGFVFQRCEIENWAMQTVDLESQCVWLLNCQFDPDGGLVAENNIVQNDPGAAIDNVIRAERVSHNLTVRENFIDTDSDTRHDHIQNSFQGDIRNYVCRNNTLRKRKGGEGKGVIIVISNTAENQSCLIENNDIDGFDQVNWGIACLVSNAIVRGNKLKGITAGSQSNPLRFVQAHADNVPVITGNVVEDNFVDGGEIGVLFGFDEQDSWEGSVRHNTLINVGLYAASQPSSDPPTTHGEFSRNIVVSANGRGTMVGDMDFVDNYFHGVGGESDTGPDPQVDSDGCITVEDALGYGRFSCDLPFGDVFSRFYGDVGDNVGATPADHTPRWDSPSGSWTVEEAEGADNERALVAGSIQAQARNLVTWNVLDSASNRDKIEVLARVSLPSITKNAMVVALVSGASAQDATGRRAAMTDSNGLEVRHYLNGSLSAVLDDDGELLPATGAWSWLRARFYGGAYAVKIWGTSEAEPPGWQVVGFSRDLLNAPGWAGFLVFEGGLQIDKWAAATGGGVVDIAELEEAEPPPDPDVFGRPANLRVVNEGFDSITWAWDAVVDASGYDIRLDGDVIEQDWPDTTVTVEDLNQGSPHALEVRAVKDLAA